MEIEFDLEASESHEPRNKIATFAIKNSVGYAKLKLFYLVESGEESQLDMASIHSQFERARDVFRQIGVEIVQDGEVNVVDTTDEFHSFYYDENHDQWGLLNPFTYGGYKDYLYDLFSSDEYISCVFTPYSIAPYYYPGSEYGIQGFWSSVVGGQTGFLLVSTEEREYVFAHEVGHALQLNHSNQVQSDEELYYDPHMLMSPRVNPYFSDYKDAKHFWWKALQKCKTSIYFNEYE